MFEYYEQLPVSKVEIFCRRHVSGQIREFGHPIDYLDKNFLESGYTFHMFFGNECDAPKYLNESRKAWEKMQKEINAVTPAERAKFYKIFGKSKACSIAKDKDGYYVRTHRARSKSYKNIEDIPKKDVDFVRSTS